MPRYTTAQINDALRKAGMNRSASNQDLRNAEKYGLSIFGRTQKRLLAPTTATPAASSPEDVSKSFIDQIRDLLKTGGQAPTVTPFDQSGFYNDADTRALADQEYDPYYRRLGEQESQDQDLLARQRQLQEAGADHTRMEEVNAAGGMRSSAYLKEMKEREAMRLSDADMRRQALIRAQEQRRNQMRVEKEQFVQNRRNDAFSRYQQSLGTL